MRLARTLSIAIVVVACTTPPPLQPARRIPADVIQPIVDRIRHEAAQRISLRGLARVKVDSESTSGSVQEVIVVERPDRLRLEMRSFFGRTQAVLVTEGGRYAYYEGGVVERGPLARDVIRQRLGLDLTAEEAVETLLAAADLDPTPTREAHHVADEHWVETGSRRIPIVTDGDLRGITALDPEGGVRWRAEYSRWRDLDGERYPFTVRLVFPETGVTAELALRDVELNPSLDPEVFQLKVDSPR